MNYFELCTNILNNAGKHKFVREVYYGDVYEFNNLPNRKYPNFVLTANGSSVSGDITTYQFNAFLTDRLVDDKSNTLEVQSECKTILEQIFANGFTGLDNISYTVWTEKFNDLCAGCYASFSISLPNELICVDDDLFNKVVKEINANGEYSVSGFDTVVVDVQPTSEKKAVTITENNSYQVIQPTDADYLESVEVTVQVPEPETDWPVVTYTENGSYIIFEEGKLLYGAQVNVVVPQTQTVFMTSEEYAGITPDANTIYLITD